MLAAITPCLVFSAFLLLLLVTLSVPITKTIYLLRLTAYVGTNVLDASVGAVARFGVWGYCISSINVSVVGISGNALSQQQCSNPRLGYDFDDFLKAALQAQNLNPAALSRTITAVLVLHPIACGITFLALCISCYVVYATRQPREPVFTRPVAWSILGLQFLATLLTTVVFIFDVIFVAAAKSEIQNDSNGAATGTWGNAVWMVLGAAIALWGAFAGTTLALFKTRSPKRYRQAY